MGNKTMGLNGQAHQSTTLPSSAPREKTTKQSNGTRNQMEELAVKNRFGMLSRLVKVES